MDAGPAIGRGISGGQSRFDRCHFVIGLLHGNAWLQASHNPYPVQVTPRDKQSRERRSDEQVRLAKGRKFEIARRNPNHIERFIGAGEPLQGEWLAKNAFAAELPLPKTVADHYFMNGLRRCGAEPAAGSGRHV